MRTSTSGLFLKLTPACIINIAGGSFDDGLLEQLGVENSGMLSEIWPYMDQEHIDTGSDGSVKVMTPGWIRVRFTIDGETNETTERLLLGYQVSDWDVADGTVGMDGDSIEYYVSPTYVYADPEDSGQVNILDGLSGFKLSEAMADFVAFEKIPWSTMERLTYYFSGNGESLTPGIYYVSDTHMESVSDIADSWRVGAFAASEEDKAWLAAPERAMARIGLNPYKEKTTTDLLIPMTQLLANERRQTDLLLINLVATLIASDGVRQMIAFKAQHEAWEAADYVNGYTTELANETINLLTAMGVTLLLDNDEIRTISRALAGYVYRWAEASGWRLPSGLSIDELESSDLGRRLSREVPAQVALMQRELAQAVACFTRDARDAKRASEASAALSTVGTATSVIRALM